jgi:S-formylglutathione hydrolase FrmB
VTLRRSSAFAGVGAALVAFLAVGMLGVHGYVGNFLSFRGYDAPRDPAYVAQPGTTVKLAIPSRALGGRAQEAYVYLPSGYAAHPLQHYAVLYLLHGVPGRPLAWLETVRMGVIDDEASALGKEQPLILVMPFGSTGTFTDKEWVDGATPGNGWATFVSRDLVHYVDTHYRTIPTRSGRAIGGLSEGGYGAINIALHHPDEFSVVESWSGYEQPARLRSIYGPNLQLLAANDPMTQLPTVATLLRRLHTYFWFYSGTRDRFRHQNAAFAGELRRLEIPALYFEARGGHDWSLWRRFAPQGYDAAAERLHA